MKWLESEARDLSNRQARASYWRSLIPTRLRRRYLSVAARYGQVWSRAGEPGLLFCAK